MEGDTPRRCLPDFFSLVRGEHVASYREWYWSRANSKGNSGWCPVGPGPALSLVLAET